jgi:V8-like Glu-specific endopeptidase
MVAMVLSYFPNMQGQLHPYAVGSATLINSNALLTAAHVIYDPSQDRGGFADKWDIFFGDQSTALNVPGTKDGNGRVRQQWINEGWVNPLSQVDAGVILLDNPASPKFAVPRKTSLNDFGNLPINVMGFPADKLVPNLYGFLVGARTYALNLGPPLNGFRIGYPEYTYDGMSGGPVLRVDEIGNGSFSVRGVHTSLVNNMGNCLMLYDDLFDQVNRWAQGAA